MFLDELSDPEINKCKVK